MTDLTEETNRETEMSEAEAEEMEKSVGGGHGGGRSSDFLYELNLIVTVLSLFSFSPEDCTDNGSKEDDEDAKAAAVVSARKREREVHDYQKPLVQRAQRFQPMIKDSRHGRKM